VSEIIFRAVLVLAACSISSTAVGGARDTAPTPPRVYIFTAQTKGGVTPEDEQGRVDSVRDLRDALRRNAKIVLVPEADGAQVLVEVVGREKRDAPGGGFGGTVLTPAGETIVRLRVTFGAHETENKGIGQSQWTRAAKDAAARLVKWIQRMSATP
jgi:hypothetical protein